MTTILPLYLDGQDICSEVFAEPRMIQHQHRADEIENIVLKGGVV